MEILLQLRDVLPIEHFISIRFSIEFPSNFTGHLIYLRQDYEGYQLGKGDDIDNSILELFKSFSAKANFQYRKTLITKQEFEHALLISQGGIEKDVVLHFFPIADIETYAELSINGQLKSVPKKLRATFWADESSSIDVGFKLNHYLRIPLNSMKLLNTLKRV